MQLQTQKISRKKRVKYLKSPNLEPYDGYQINMTLIFQLLSTQILGFLVKQVRVILKEKIFSLFAKEL